ncbi:hypothetical protein [Streptomyces sp. TR06-5]|uniref:hypothetical protein n=1 Tax=unclassified Streptomyces TaxID=2593676 RepID=UPI0039A0DDB6
MSAPDLLVVIDPVARATDGESVRITRDVLCAGARDAKVCVPDGPAEMARFLARRGGRRPVVVGDDRALLRAVQVLHRERELARCALSVVPVGAASATALTRSLGVPGDAVEASRAVLGGTDRAMDLLVDDSGGVVLGALSVPARSAPEGVAREGRVPEQREAPEDSGSGVPPAADPAEGGGPGAERIPALRGYRSLVRSLAARPLPVLGALAGGVAAVGGGAGAVHRLRVEADGTVLADLDRPVAGVSVAPGGNGTALVTVRRRMSSDAVCARARSVTVSGPDFRYRADAVVGGPVRVRTWTALGTAWWLRLPVRCAADGAGEGTGGRD